MAKTKDRFLLARAPEGHDSRKRQAARSRKFPANQNESIS